MRGPVTLIIDPDPGFVCWLGQLLSQAGSEVIPALSCREAIRLVAELNLPIDLAIVDPGLRGVNRAIRTLRKRFPLLRTVVVRTADQDAMPAIDGSTTLKRTFGSVQASRQQWLTSVRGILKNVMAAGPELRVGGKLLVNDGWLSRR